VNSGQWPAEREIEKKRDYDGEKAGTAGDREVDKPHILNKNILKFLQTGLLRPFIRKFPHSTALSNRFLTGITTIYCVDAEKLTNGQYVLI
jgi:hypothetical protein